MCMNFFEKRRAEKDEAIREAQKAIKEEEKKKEYEKVKKILDAEPDWMEIEGYKAVDSRANSFIGHCHYEIGKKNVLKGEIVPCENGFHFCKTLEDVLEHFPPKLGTRYFKVKALVPTLKYYTDGKVKLSPKSCGRMLYEKAYRDYLRDEKMGDICSCKPCPELYEEYNWKLVAKEITFIEEVSFSEFADKICNDFITSEEDYRYANNISKYSYLACKKITEEAKGIFSEAFINYLYTVAETKLSNGSHVSNDVTYYVDNAYQAMKKALAAIKDENISQDVRVLMMMKILEV